MALISRSLCKNDGNKISYEYIFFTFLSCAASFFLGTWQATDTTQTPCMETKKSNFDAIVGRRVRKGQQKTHLKHLVHIGGTS